MFIISYIEWFAVGVVKGKVGFTSAVADEITTGAPDLHSKQKLIRKQKPYLISDNKIR